MKKELGLFLLLAALCGLTAGINPRFLSAANLTNMANVIGLFGVFSLGLGLVIITGGIDLSGGSMFALTGVLLSMALNEWHWAWPLAAAGAIALPMLLGWGHGLAITRLGVQPFIVTLCGLLLYRGIARFVAADSTKGFGSQFEILRGLASGKLWGVPMPFVVLVVVAVLMWVLLERSVYGRYLFAVGRNEEAARFSGINPRRVIAVSYVVAGLLTGLSGIMIAFYTNSVAPSNHGNFYELYGIAAAVLGGCSLRGGEGSILGILIGATMLQVLQNLVNLLGIPSSLNFAVMGAVVLVSVVTEQFFRSRRQVHRPPG